MKTTDQEIAALVGNWAGDTPLDKAVVLVSGGLDSTTLLHWVRAATGARALLALSFAYGQRHARELEMAAAQARLLGGVTHRVVDLQAFGALVQARTALLTAGSDVPDLAALSETDRRQPPTYVPHRNLLFLALAAAAAEGFGCLDVFYGAQVQDAYGYWDCTPEFVDRLNRVLMLNHGDPVRIHAPFARLAKGAIIKIGLALGVDYTHTWTCYRGGERPCGTCPSCVERQAAFRAAGVPDPL